MHWFFSFHQLPQPSVRISKQGPSRRRLLSTRFRSGQPLLFCSSSCISRQRALARNGPRIRTNDRGERNDLERELDGQKPDRFTSTTRRESDVVPEHDLPGFNSQTNLKRLPVATFAFSEQLGAASLFGVGPPLA